MLCRSAIYRRSLPLVLRGSQSVLRTTTHVPTPSVVARSSMFTFQGPGSDALRNQSCGGACSSDTAKVDAKDLDRLMAAIPSWTLNEDQKSLKRKFIARNFMAAVRFFNMVAEVAEAEGHHPDLHLTNYREVEVVVSTHAAGGLTMFDFVLAAKLDAIEGVEYSPKWLQKQEEEMKKTTGS